jgi:hypothetical protein
MPAPWSRTATIPAGGCSCDSNGLEWRTPKYPDDTIDYAVSFGLWADNEGQDIVSVVVNPPPGLILARLPTVSDNVAQMRFKGGAPGVNYGVQVTGFTASGEAISSVIYLEILATNGQSDVTLAVDPEENYSDSLIVSGCAMIIGGNPILIGNPVDNVLIGSVPVTIAGRPIFPGAL